MWILIALALVFALAGSAMVAWAVWGETLMRRRRLADTIAQVDGPQDAVEETEAIGVDDLDRAETITRLIESRPWSETLQLELLRAGWVIRPSEFVAYTALFCAAGLAGAAGRSGGAVPVVSPCFSRVPPGSGEPQTRATCARFARARGSGYSCTVEADGRKPESL